MYTGDVLALRRVRRKVQEACGEMVAFHIHNQMATGYLVPMTEVSGRASDLSASPLVGMVGPPHRQLPIRHTNFHHQRPRHGLTLKPIDA